MLFKNPFSYVIFINELWIDDIAFIPPFECFLSWNQESTDKVITDEIPGRVPYNLRIKYSLTIYLERKEKVTVLSWVRVSIR